MSELFFAHVKTLHASVIELRQVVTDLLPRVEALEAALIEKHADKEEKPKRGRPAKETKDES
jgi:hypothetical protein